MTSTTPPPQPNDEGDDLLHAVGGHLRAAHAAKTFEQPRASDSEVRSRVSARFFEELNSGGQPPLQSLEARSPTAQVPVTRYDQRAKFMLCWGAPVVAAAAMTVWISGQPRPRTDETAITTSIPNYVAEVHGAVAQERGNNENQRPKLRLETPITVVLRPETVSSNSVDARAFAIAANGEIRQVDIGVERSPSGSLRLTFSPTSLHEPATRLTVLVGPSEILTPTLALGPADDGPGWQRFSWNLGSDERTLGDHE